LLHFPHKIKKIFHHLNQNNAKPIVVGGYIRDHFLHVKYSKDIDIEVFHINSYEELTSLLAPFGSLHLVGKSFGTCKLFIDEYELDFTLPRKENKTSKGHKGFKIKTDPYLSFEEAASRRDFTINAIGYDPIKKEFLDPFNGKKDIQNKVLKAVDPQKFTEDPLRVYRAVGFASRFEFLLNEQLFTLCQTMINRGDLTDLPKERVYEELKKMFLKSNKPSYGLELLYTLEEHTFFNEILSLKKEYFFKYIQSFDRIEHKDMVLYLALLGLHVNIERFTNEKELLLQVKKIHDTYKTLIHLTEKGWNDFNLKLLATRSKLSQLIEFTQALFPHLTCKLQKIRQKAEELGVLDQALPPFVTGKKLISLGLKPSKDFKKILDTLYIKQLKNELPDDDNKLLDLIRSIMIQ